MLRCNIKRMIASALRKTVTALGAFSGVTMDYVEPFEGLLRIIGHKGTKIF
jgi:hypothetical protein